MMDFAAPPVALTRRQRLFVIIVSVIAAITRIAAVARGPWDWDEMLFLLGLQDYDVALHHPHPPGFPLYMLAARALVSIGIDEFRALQSLNVVAGMLAVPAMMFLCRELRFRFEVSIAAAVVFAFLPNVWFFGGTAFSDVVSIVLAVTACGLLLRGSRDGASLIAGAVVLALATGFRPQNLLVGMVPALIATWQQTRRGRYGVVAIAIATGAAIVMASYAGAVAATGEWSRYRDAVVAHQRYLAAVDSFHSPIRPPLFQVFDDFFIRPFRFPVANVVTSLLAAMALFVAAARRRWPALVATATFGPFWILAWLTLDFHSSSRFSIGYMPLLAILTADGLDLVTARRRTWLVALTSLLVAAMSVWTWPALTRVRNDFSPPLQAVRSLAAETSTIYVQKRLRPWTEYYLHDRSLVHVEETLPPGASDGVFLREGRSAAPGTVAFVWPRDRLWNIARRRYFEVAVVPVAASPAPTPALPRV